VHRFPILRTVFVAGLAAVLGACGGGGSTVSGQPAASGGAATTSAAAKAALDGLTADQIAKKAIARLSTTSSVRITGAVSDSGDKITLDETEVIGKGCDGSFGLGTKGSFKIRIIGAATWMNPDRTFWKAQGLTDAAALTALSGKWIKLSPKSDLSALAKLCTMSALLGDKLTTTGDMGLTKGATTTIGGRQALTLKDTGSSDALYVFDGVLPGVAVAGRRRRWGVAELQRLRRCRDPDATACRTDHRRRQVRGVTAGV
jgi:hypothetical protein